MQTSERDELRRAIHRFQELATPHKLLGLLAEFERLSGEERERLVTPVEAEELTNWGVTSEPAKIN